MFIVLFTPIFVQSTELRGILRLEISMIIFSFTGRHCELAQSPQAIRTNLTLHGVRLKLMPDIKLFDAPI